MAQRRSSRARAGVFRLNQGSSTLGQRSVFPLGQEGGTFLSGRPSGGAGTTTTPVASPLLSALSGVQGPVADVGPPPVEQAPLPPPPPEPSHLPSFTASVLDPLRGQSQPSQLVWPTLQALLAPRPAQNPYNLGRAY